MTSPFRSNRLTLRTLFFVFAVVAFLCCISFYLTRPDYAQHIRRARAWVGKPAFTSTSNECNQREQCTNGDEYYLYFFSTNGRDRGFVQPYMITVITFPGGEQYFKIEPFDYSRSRAIADPAAEFQTNMVWLRKHGPIERQDIWQIRNAMSHDDLYLILQRNDFKSAR